MGTRQADHLFILGRDYHLGDLLWFTAVLAAYRQRTDPARVIVACPDRPISGILAGHPLVDELVRYPPMDGGMVRGVRARHSRAVVHDLRPVPIALSMLRAWRYRLPWLYLRDLWLDERGQWLATYLRLGRLSEVRPVLALEEADRVAARGLARELQARYVVLAPHTGRYALPLLGAAWHRLKGWSDTSWAELAAVLRADGYEPVTLGAAGQPPIRGTRAVTGLPIRQAAGVIEGAAALVGVESGLWYIAAALGRPFIVVPWWLPRSLDWAAPMGVPHRLIARRQATVAHVQAQLRALLSATVIA